MLDFKHYPWWYRYELREARGANIHGEALPERWQYFRDQL
jgi:hypothetical protein